MKISAWTKAWAGLSIISLAVGCGGVAVSFKALASIKTWEGRYYQMSDQYQAAKAEIKELRAQLEAANVSTKKVIISVVDAEKSKKTLARQNRNYLNIKKLPNGQKWEGEIGVDKFGHVIFSDAGYSVRAGAIILKNYERKHKINTVEDLVNRFCQSNRKEYTGHLCRELGVKPDTKISLTKNLHKIIPAMIYFETGEKVGLEYTEIIKAVQG